MKHRLLVAVMFLSAGIAARAQRILSEGTVQYDISVERNGGSPAMADMFDGATAVLYLRGSLSRSEVNSALGGTTTIYDHRSGSGVVLREFGAQRLLIKLTRQNWEDKNRKYEGIVFKNTGERKEVAGFPCEKAEATMKDGTRFSVYYSRELVAENATYDPQFSALQGMALEYESVQGNMRIRYSAKSVSFDPVPMQKFEVPRTGYREMSYEESIRKGGN